MDFKPLFFIVNRRKFKIKCHSDQRGGIPKTGKLRLFHWGIFRLNRCAILPAATLRMTFF